MRNSNGGPFLKESLSLTDSFSRAVPASWFSCKFGKGRGGLRGCSHDHDPQNIHEQTLKEDYLYDSRGVGRGEDRRVVVNIRNVNVYGDSRGHGRGAAVERLHRQRVPGYLDKAEGDTRAIKSLCIRQYGKHCYDCIIWDFIGSWPWADLLLSVLVVLMNQKITIDCLWDIVLKDSSVLFLCRVAYWLSEVLSQGQSRSGYCGHLSG